MSSVFPAIILIGRPAAGKSEAIAFLKKTGSSVKRNVYLDTAQRMFNLDNVSNESRNENEEPHRK